jgi:hypothetical protein
VTSGFQKGFDSMFGDATTLQIITAAALGLGLAAAVGFRVFVPMFLVGIAARGDLVSLGAGFDWLASDVALIMFAVAAALEIAAYFIPFFDHLLDVLAGPAAITAGTVLMASALVDISPWLRWTLAIVAGGGTAGVFHGATSGLRAGSTATTGGLANPAFAGLETGSAVVVTLLALLVPLIALVLLLVLLVQLLRKVGRRLKLPGFRQAQP